MRVYVLEGVHGSGKTTLINSLPKDQVVYDEAVLNQSFDWPLQSIGMEMQWLMNWFHGLSELKHHAVVWTDRGPSSAVQYTRDKATRKLVEPIVRQLIEDFEAEHDCRFHFVKVVANEEVLSSRIKQRQIEREHFNEADMDWIRSCRDFYDSQSVQSIHGRPWHAHLDTTSATPEDCCGRLMRYV